MSDSLPSSNITAPANAPKEPSIKPHFFMTPSSLLPPSATTWTRNSPLIRSPLQKSFEPEMSKSEPGSPNSATTPGTSSRRFRLGGQVGRARGESRSSSVPVIIRTHKELEADNEDTVQQFLQPSSRAGSRIASPLPSPTGNRDGPDRRSVKHLTCFWFWTKGVCKYSDEECLYAHRDTGLYTSAPRQVVPGEPAKAGKSLERALNKIALTSRSSVSLPPTGAADSITGDNLNVAASTPSRPVTPFSAHGRSHAGTPSPRSSADFSYSIQLRNDNELLRSVVEDTLREKVRLQDTILSLEKEKCDLSTEVDKVKEDFSTLLEERETLQATIRMLQFPAGVNPHAQNALGTGMRSTSTGVALQNIWGPIGSTRGTGSSGFCTPNGTPADSPTMPTQQRYFSYPSAGAGGLRADNAFALNPAAPACGSAIRLSHHGGGSPQNNVS